MSRRFSKIVPVAPLELERFYLDTINKLEGTDSTLADEEKKSAIPVVGMIHDINRKLESLARDSRNMRLLVESSRQEQENRLLRSQITRLENRISDLERRL